MRTDTLRRCATVAVVPLVLLAGLSTAPVPAAMAATTTSSPTPATSFETLPKGVVVHAGVHGTAQHATASRRFLTRGGRSSDTGSAAATAPTASGPPAGVVTSFAGSSLDSDVACCGGAPEQGVEPPDTQVAAGPSDIVEAVNSVMRITNKAGVEISTTDLNSFFGGPPPSPYSFTDPRVAWDNAAQRWYLSGFIFDSTNDSIMKIATSNTADPNGSWTVTTIATETKVVTDQPKIGFDSNVLVMAWDDYPNGNSWSGTETYVLQKSDLDSGTTVTVAHFGATTQEFSVVPAQSYDGGTTAYAAENDSCGNNTVGTCDSHSASQFQLISYTGTPAAHNVARGTTNIGMTPTLVPKNADEPGNTAVISTNDDRFLNDVLVNGTMYVTGNNACTAARVPCARVIEVNVSNATMPVDTDLSPAGLDVYFPAPIVDPAGDLAIAATESSSTQFPEPALLTEPAGAGSFTNQPLTSAAGTASYMYSTCLQSNSQLYPCRWGDYSGAAMDPTAPSNLWLASEWGGTSDHSWGTEIYEAAFREMTNVPSTTSTAAATPFTTTVTVTDGTGATLTSYRGTVHFTSTDASASLPTDYSFTSGDAGSHTFPVTLNTVGSQTITATDAADGLAATTPSITVTVGATAKLSVTAPSSSVPNQEFPVTVRAEDAGGNTTPAYTGTVHFTSSDPSATLPADYTFQSSDHGVHTFTAELQTLGNQTITATDTVTPSITGTTATIAVAPQPLSLSSTQQYNLKASDGSTWVPIDSSRLGTTVEFTTANTAVVTGNADLWTAVAGYNQDIGIQVTPQGGAATVIAWKESGGFAGTFSPNAAAVQGTFPMSANTSYNIELVWKTNVPNGANGRATPSNIFASAGPNGAHSPTTLDVFFYPASNNVLFTTSHAAQYQLTSSSPGSGTDWEGVDVTHLSLTFTPSVASTAYLSANADLWTSVGGINQDIGINVAPPCNNDTLTPPVSAWKESGGNAGTFSPNAAFVQDACVMDASTTYTVTLDWKSNLPIPSGQSIFMGAGQSPSNSPTTLFAQVIPDATAPQYRVLAAQKTLTATNSDNGTTWRQVDPSLSVTLTPSSTCTAWLTANADLWTADAGFNQDLGIEITPNGGSPTVLAWKESGGFAGTFSPNAAFAQGTETLPAGTYTVTLVWRVNKAMPSGDSIWMAAGSNPNFSPTSLIASLNC